MPRRNSGPRLRFFERRGCYYIFWTEDGRSRERSTGTTDREEAEKALAVFIFTRTRRAGPRGPDETLVTTVLGDYAEVHVVPSGLTGSPMQSALLSHSGMTALSPKSTSRPAGNLRSIAGFPMARRAANCRFCVRP